MAIKNDVKLHAIPMTGKDADFFMINEICNREEKENLTLDIIIPTFKPDHKFDLLMKRLGKQTVQPKQIIILNTIPASSSKAEALKHQNEFMQKYREINHATIVHIEEADFDHAATRTYGASLSNADLVMFMTQDAIPADEYLIEELVKTFEDPQVAGAYARQLAHTNCDEIESYTRNFNYPAMSKVKSKIDIETMGIKAFFCSDVCSVYRKSIFEKLGGFVKKAIFNEDMLYAAKAIRADYKICYVAEAKVYHSHHYNYRQQFRRNFDMGVSQAQNSEVFESVKSESEGMKLVKKTADHLIKRHSYFKLVDLFFVSGFKYAGYFLGKHYRMLPKRLVLKITTNKNYWK